MGIIKVLVIEADPLRREGLVATLSSEFDMRVVGAGSDIAQAMKVISRQSLPEVVVVNADDAELAKLRGWALLRVVLPKTSIVALTSAENDVVLEILLAVGVTALCRRDAGRYALCEAVRNAARGVLDYDPSLAEQIKGVLMQPMPAREIQIGRLSVDLATGTAGGMMGTVHLTPREQQVLALLGEGRSNRQIAYALKVKESTVSFHVSNVLRKLGVHSRAEAGLAALLIQFFGPSG